METISDVTPIESPAPATVALSPLEQMRAKIHDAEKAFAETLRAEFVAIYDRINELEDEMRAAHFIIDERLNKALLKVVKGLDEVISTLNAAAMADPTPPW